MNEVAEADAVVIGGGYYGCRIALRLKELGVERVVLAEQESAIMRHASYCNQARVHQGYHYPRSLSTAIASHWHYPRWIEEHQYAINSRVRSFYALAEGSQVNPNQFERFCQEIGAPYRHVRQSQFHLFNPERVLTAYEVEECVFDSGLVADDLLRRLREKRVEVLTATRAMVIDVESSMIQVSLNGRPCQTRLLFNCTYAMADKVGLEIRTPLQREWVEMALVVPTADLEGLGVTVMDGPYFSCLPFPPKKMHTLSHVRFTPILAWADREEEREVSLSTSLGAPINGQAMLRDAARYMPSFERMRVEQSMFTTKTVLAGNEGDDGRPILFETDPRTGNIVTILGAKIDNIYDALDEVDAMVRGNW